ncbi:hypothetical protein HMPREF9455_03372 [Dysgonomonas gadei ATCC BAA-286]|uniref:Uncharacterized protein n=1 Tax=Dysgonomonas gadei ATCC BAA-286 TaxID=742766 RepID=F5J1X7_9BACT|nr:hypothetical protein HMPREF9455_03372 [Dysgonomonas gadei ATCC BAA-286]
MEIVCIDLLAWERLKQQIGRLKFEVSALKELYCSNPRDG